MLTVLFRCIPKNHQRYPLALNSCLVILVSISMKVPHGWKMLLHLLLTLLRGGRFRGCHGWFWTAPPQSSHLMFKIATLNMKGLSNLVKLKALWNWIWSHKLDILCIQEHKLHHFAAVITYYKGYTLIYGGHRNLYSSALIIICSSLSPTVLFNHESGRRLSINFLSPFGLLLCICIYGHTMTLCHAYLYGDISSLFPLLQAFY